MCAAVAMKHRTNSNKRRNKRHPPLRRLHRLNTALRTEYVVIYDRVSVVQTSVQQVCTASEATPTIMVTVDATTHERADTVCHDTESACNVRSAVDYITAFRCACEG